MRWGLLVVALLAAGCVARPRLGEQCELNTGCSAPLVCRLARCRHACATDRDCAFGARCVIDESGSGSCLLPDEDECALDGDCPGELVCANRRCTNECATDRDCPPGTSCEEEACEAPQGSACRSDIDCVAPLACVESLCRDRCVNDRDCREGAACTEDGVCMAIGAGMDAGAGDAGSDAAMDAGTDASSDASADAGLDAAPPLCVTVADCPGTFAAMPDCVEGFCVVASCRLTTQMDCDGLYFNGCEARPDSDVRHCGGCGMACGVGEACFESACEAATIVEEASHPFFSNHRCVRWSNGRVTCWGRDFGYSYPTPVPGLTDATEICAGERYTCVRRASGQVHCWGNGGDGRLGNGDTMDRATPTPVLGLTDAEAIACGSVFACALRTTGEIWCWGANNNGYLGSGSTARNSPTPMTVSGITDGAAIVAIGGTTCALRDSGEVWCWGDSRNGELGNGSLGESNVPVQVMGLAGLTVQGLSQALGAFHVRLDDGRVLCWGAHGGSFYCGLRERDDRIPTPRVVPDLMGATAIEGSCAILATGAHVCWGHNYAGRLGLGHFDSPVDRVTPTGWTGLDGLGDGCILIGGGIRCAGDNTHGQLGTTRSGVDENVYVRPEGLP